jgi:hypothetical protein
LDTNIPITTPASDLKAAQTAGGTLLARVDASMVLLSVECNVTLLMQISENKGQFSSSIKMLGPLLSAFVPSLFREDAA